MIIVAVAVALCTAYLLWQIISADLVEPDDSPRDDIPARTTSKDAPPAWLLNSELSHKLAELKVDTKRIDRELTVTTTKS